MTNIAEILYMGASERLNVRVLDRRKKKQATPDDIVCVREEDVHTCFFSTSSNSRRTEDGRKGDL